MAKSWGFLRTQYYPQVTHLIILAFGVYQNIVNKENHKQIMIIPNNSVHKVHKSRGVLVRSKGHD